jgi:hypothetical protein
VLIVVVDDGSDSLTCCPKQVRVGWFGVSLPPAWVQKSFDLDKRRVVTGRLGLRQSWWEVFSSFSSWYQTEMETAV